MQSDSNFWGNVLNLIKEGHKWQYTDLSGYGKKPKIYFSYTQIFFFIVSCIGVYFLPKGFSKDFIGYTMAALAVFIGLFISITLNAFDKFQNIDFKKVPENDNEKVLKKLSKNFFRQFTALTCYGVIISVICIVLLSLSLLCDVLGTDITNYSFVDSWQLINIQNFGTFVRLFFLIVYRILILYFLLDFIYLVLVSLGKLFEYITFEVEKVERIIKQREEYE